MLLYTAVYIHSKKNLNIIAEYVSAHIQTRVHNVSLPIDVLSKWHQMYSEGALHSKEATISKQNSLFFLLLKWPPGGSGGLDYSFRTLFKIYYKTRNLYSISLNFNKDKQLIDEFPYKGLHEFNKCSGC